MNERPTHLTGLPLFFATVGISLATFLIVLDYSIANVSIPYIAGDLAVSPDQGTYVITSFAIGNAIVLPITGWLTKRIGIVRLIILSLLLFTFFSWICGISRTLPMLVTARFIQGAVAGPLIPLSQTLIVSIYPPEKKNIATAFWSMVVMVAPLLGPVLGGWLSYDYSWPWIFFINLPLGVIAAIIIKTFLTKYETKRASTPLDWFGLLLLAIGVSSLQFVLDKGQQFDWMRSPLIRTLSITSFVSFSYLIAWELTHPQPVLELKLFKIRSFTFSIIFIAVAYAIYFGTVVLIPLWLQTSMNYTPIWAGLAVAPMGIACLLFSSYIGKLVNKVGSITPLFISFSLFAISCFATAYFDTDVDFFHIAFTRFLLGCGLLFFITPLMTLNIQDVSLEKLPTGTGMFHFVRAMFGAVGTSVFTTLMTRRSAFHHSNIGAYVTDAWKPAQDLIDRLKMLGFRGKKLLTIVNDLVDQQAAVLAINDCFYLMGWTFIILILLLPFAKKHSWNKLLKIKS